MYSLSQCIIQINEGSFVTLDYLGRYEYVFCTHALFFPQILFIMFFVHCTSQHVFNMYIMICGYVFCCI